MHHIPKPKYVLEAISANGSSILLIVQVSKPWGLGVFSFFHTAAHLLAYDTGTAFKVQSKSLCVISAVP